MLKFLKKPLQYPVLAQYVYSLPLEISTRLIKLVRYSVVHCGKSEKNIGNCQLRTAEEVVHK